MSASEMSTQAKREYVEKVWEFVRTWVRDLDSYGTDQFNIALFHTKQSATWCENSFKRWQEDNTKAGIKKAINAAFAFTKERERQIAEIEEEIQWLETVQSIFYSNKNRAAAKKRILAREQAALQEMRRGMRSESNG